LPPPLTAKMTDEDGIVTPQWANFFNTVYRYEQAVAAAADDGTYVVGLGTTDGEITLTNGIVTAVQEVVA
jgi:hypothetical protein